jgi:hypothetical protein
MRTNMWKFLIISISCDIVFSRLAHAYLDPGTGSYMLQILIAGVLAFFFFAKSFLNKLKAFIRKIIGRKDDTK